jgi:uncharacterized protein YrrD
MRFAKGLEVYTASGEKIGTINRIVIDAKTRDVTDLVVDRGLLSGEKVIPVGLVDTGQEDRIVLQETNQGVDDFLDYETKHYIPAEQRDGTDEKYYFYPPLQLQMPPGAMVPGIESEYVLQTETSIPEGRIAIAQGAQVVSADEKHVGNIEQVIADSNSNHVSHFVVGRGFLLKEHKLVPARWITNVAEEKVHLSVEARVLEQLPDYEPD